MGVFLVPFAHRCKTVAGKTVHTLRILLEGDRLWCEDAVEAALAENGLVPKAMHAVTFEGKSCVLAHIDTTKTDMGSMYSAEELEPTDKTTHRWCTYHIIMQNGAPWLPPPTDLPFSHPLFVHILKACDVDYLNGDLRSS